MTDLANASETAKLSIRKIMPGDAAPVAALSGQLGYETSTEAMAERIAKLGAAGEVQAVFVACMIGSELAEQVVGWIDIAITFHLQTEPFALIGGLVVKDGIRGAGIGKRLCETAESWVRSQGIKVLRVTSRSTRLDAHRFYLRDGYTEIKTSKVFEKMLA